MVEPTTTNPLTVERIVEAASSLVSRGGLAGLSMRKLGAELGVDPMAVYHHVPNKRALLALIISHKLAGMGRPDPTAPWDSRVRQWAGAYWEIVVANRDLILAALADPAIGAGGLPSTDDLVAAVRDSGLARDRAEANAYLVVDTVHGSALGVALGDPGGTANAEARRLFDAGLDTILAGIASLAER